MKSPESWDDAFQELGRQWAVPESFRHTNERAVDHKNQLKAFADISQELEYLLTQCDANTQDPDLLTALDLVSISQQDTSASFFSTRIGRRALTRDPHLSLPCLTNDGCVTSLTLSQLLAEATRVLPLVRSAAACSLKPRTPQRRRPLSLDLSTDILW